jgi:phage baseplate assembly protein W
VLAWLLGAVPGEPGEGLNAERLGSLLEKLVDTPVRGFVFEAPVGGEGLEAVEDAAARWRIPVQVVNAERQAAGAWAVRVADAVERSVGLG